MESCYFIGARTEGLLVGCMLMCFGDLTTLKIGEGSVLHLV